MGNQRIEFSARFAGVEELIRVPISSVLGIYARESGEGMIFTDEQPTPEPPGADPGPSGSRPSHLKVVK